MPGRFITIPFSHYCEKARWALDRARIDYVEEPHVPMFAWAPTLRAGRSRTVPVLVLDDDVLIDSHDILARAHRIAPDAGLYPDDIASEVEALEAAFDRKVGPAARRLAYHALMADPTVIRDLFVHETPAWEAATTRALLPVMVGMIRRGLKINDAGAARSNAQLAPVFADVEARLAKSGGPWLFGERFTAADLTFASLMTPLVAPPEFSAKHLCERFIDLENLRTLVGRHRDRPAGELVLRAYAEQRARAAR